MNDIYYFAYGYNLDKNKLEHRLGIEVNELGLAKLKDYSIEFRHFTKKHQGLASTISEKPSAYVFGKLYSITNESLDKLDIFEGVDREVYTRIELKTENITPLMKFDMPNSKIISYQLHPRWNEYYGLATYSRSYIETMILSLKSYKLENKELKKYVSELENRTKYIFEGIEPKLNAAIPNKLIKQMFHNIKLKLIKEKTSDFVRISRKIGISLNLMRNELVVIACKNNSTKAHIDYNDEINRGECELSYLIRKRLDINDKVSEITIWKLDAKFRRINILEN